MIEAIGFRLSSDYGYIITPICEKRVKIRRNANETDYFMYERFCENHKKIPENFFVKILYILIFMCYNINMYNCVYVLLFSDF